MAVDDGYGLVGAKMGNDARGNLTVTALCECAVTTIFTVHPVLRGGETAWEFAYTCDGCATSHWLTLRVVPPREGP